MTLIGTVKNGAIELPAGISLQDGLQVTIEVSESTEPLQAASELGRMLLKHAGTVDDLPPDAALNHDRYLYGALKR